MTSELRALRNDPFELLQRLDARLRTARLDSAAGQAQSWSGMGFRLGGDWLVAPRDDVREVIVPPRLTRVPNAHPWLQGVANVRGALLGVIDLHHFLGGEPAPAQRGQRLLVYNSENVPAGFLVDEVAGHRHFVPADQRSGGSDAPAALAPYLLGAFVRDGQPWFALSLHKLALSDAFRHAGL